MRFVKVVVVVGFLILGWLIGWTNNQPTSFSFLDWNGPELPAYVHYFVFLSSGIMIGLFLGRLSAKR